MNWYNLQVADHRQLSELLLIHATENTTKSKQLWQFDIFPGDTISANIGIRFWLQSKNSNLNQNMNIIVYSIINVLFDFHL